MVKKLIFSLITIAISLQLVYASESSESASSVTSEKSQLKNNHNGNVQGIPVITNEAEYAAWIKQRERASRASSTVSSKILASKTAKSTSSRSVKE